MASASLCGPLRAVTALQQFLLRWERYDADTTHAQLWPQLWMALLRGGGNAPRRIRRKEKKRRAEETANTAPHLLVCC